MTRRTKTGKTLSDDEVEALADQFEKTDFSPDDVAKIKKIRLRSPRIGDTNAEVVTFRAPASYNDRIKARADATTESQVIRDALDAYL